MDPLLLLFICIGILAGIVFIFFLLSFLVLVIGSAHYPDDLNDDHDTYVKDRSWSQR